VERVLAFWPLLILLITYSFQRFFKGNMVAAASTVYIEVIRGVPLITVLFMAIIMAPLFLPSGVQIKNAWAVLIAFRNVRGGLQAIPKGQYEAADALGLNTLQKMRFIILPQALRAVIPAIVGLFIGVYKDSSLVAVVGLYELLGITNAIISNPQWLGLRTELYLFAAGVYFIGSFAMSSYSRRLETQLGVGVR
jgi:general L-amino acid transport system permease protein